MIPMKTVQIALTVLIASVLAGCHYFSDARLDFGTPLTVSQMQQLGGLSFSRRTINDIPYHAVSTQMVGSRLRVRNEIVSCQNNNCSVRTEDYFFDNVFAPGERSFGGLRLPPGWMIGEAIGNRYEYFVFRVQGRQLRYLFVSRSANGQMNGTGSTVTNPSEIIRDLNDALAGNDPQNRLSVWTFNATTRGEIANNLAQY